MTTWSLPKVIGGSSRHCISADTVMSLVRTRREKESLYGPLLTMINATRPARDSASSRARASSRRTVTRSTPRRSAPSRIGTQYWQFPPSTA